MYTEAQRFAVRTAWSIALLFALHCYRRRVRQHAARRLANRLRALLDSRHTRAATATGATLHSATAGMSTFGFNNSDSGRSSSDGSSGPNVLRKSASEGDVTLQNVAATAAAAAAVAAAAIGSGRERVASPLSRS
eukprot:17264-Heterococcus_DN1.PRE.1